MTSNNNNNKITSTAPTILPEERARDVGDVVEQGAEGDH